MKLMIFGGSGFIGRHVIEEAARQGLGVVACSRMARAANQSNVDWKRCDLTDALAVRDCVASVAPDAVINLAASGAAGAAVGFDELLKANVLSTYNVIKACKCVSSVRSFVQAGSGFEYADLPSAIAETAERTPNCDYGLSKALASDLCRLLAAHFAVTVLRVFSVYGPGEAGNRIAPYIISRARDGREIDLTPGAQTRDYIYVRDLAKIFVRAATTRREQETFETFNVGTGVVMTLREFCETLAYSLQQRGYEPDLRFGARAYRKDDRMTYLPDVSKLKSSNLIVSNTPLLEGMNATVEEFLCA